MEVVGIQKKTIKIDVSKDEILRTYNKSRDITLTNSIHSTQIKLCTSLGLPKNAYIKDGKWKQDVECYGGGHSWETTETIKEATGMEMKLWGSIAEILKEVIDLKL